MPMPSASLRWTARLPLISTMEVVCPAIFQREFLPTVVRSKVSGDWANAGETETARIATVIRTCTRYQTVTGSMRSVCFN